MLPVWIKRMNSIRIVIYLCLFTASMDTSYQHSGGLHYDFSKTHDNTATAMNYQNQHRPRYDAPTANWGQMNKMPPQAGQGIIGPTPTQVGILGKTPRPLLQAPMVSQRFGSQGYQVIYT